LLNNFSTEPLGSKELKNRAFPSTTWERGFRGNPYNPRAINIVASLQYTCSESKIFADRPGDPLEITKFLATITQGSKEKSAHNKFNSLLVDKYITKYDLSL